MSTATATNGKTAKVLDKPSVVASLTPEEHKQLRIHAILQGVGNGEMAAVAISTYLRERPVKIVEGQE